MDNRKIRHIKVNNKTTSSLPIKIAIQTALD